MSKALRALLFAALSTGTAYADDITIAIKPAAPYALQPVRAVVHVSDGCTIPAGVKFEGGRLVFALRGVECFAPADPYDIEVSLGSLVEGRYAFDVVERTGRLRSATAEFTVRAAPAGRYGAAQPWVDETGAWVSAQMPGTGLFVVDNIPGGRFAVLNTYDAAHQPTFYVLQDGILYRTSGSPLGGNATLGLDDAKPVRVGTGSLEPVAGTSRSLSNIAPAKLRLDYQIDGEAARSIEFERLDF